MYRFNIASGRLVRDEFLVPKLGTGGGGIISPADLTTHLWLDADDATTITTSGSNVSQWRDKSGNDRHFNGVNSTWPTSGTATINDKNVISFNRTFLTSSVASSNWVLLHGTSGCSIFMVMRAASVAPGSFYWLLGTVRFPGTFRGAQLQWSNGSGDTNAYVYKLSYGGSIYSVDVKQQNVFTQGTAQKLSIISDPTASPVADRHSGFIDGAALTAVNAATGSADDTNPNYNLQIGADGSNGTATALIGDVAELVIISGTVDGATRLGLEAYFDDKWGT